jgi:hypothetical protein
MGTRQQAPRRMHHIIIEIFPEEMEAEVRKKNIPMYRNLQILQDLWILQDIQNHLILHVRNGEESKHLRSNQSIWRTHITWKENQKRTSMCAGLLYKYLWMINQQSSKIQADKVSGLEVYIKNMLQHGMYIGKDKRWRESLQGLVRSIITIWY